MNRLGRVACSRRSKNSGVYCRVLLIELQGRRVPESSLRIMDASHLLLRPNPLQVYFLTSLLRIARVLCSCPRQRQTRREAGTQSHGSRKNSRAAKRRVSTSRLSLQVLNGPRRLKMASGEWQLPKAKIHRPLQGGIRESIYHFAPV